MLEIERLFRQSEWLMVNTGGDPEKLRGIVNELVAKGLQENKLIEMGRRIGE